MSKTQKPRLPHLHRAVVCMLVAGLVLFLTGCKSRSPNASDTPREECGFFGVLDTTMADGGWQIELCDKLEKDSRFGLPSTKADPAGMVLIPAGPAIVGSPYADDERIFALMHDQKHLDAFYIDTHEVTNAQYAQCVNDRQCLKSYGGAHLSDRADNPEYPAILFFEQAKRYCQWKGKRLPTEIEWEKAARTEKGNYYPWGNSPPEKPVANICGSKCTFSWADKTWVDGYAASAPVGSFPKDKSPYGVMDMAGNLKEWVTSTAPLPHGAHIARGGSWYSHKLEMRTPSRQIWRYGVRMDDKGVRCAANPENVTQ